MIIKTQFANRILSFMLTIVMCLTMLPATAFAAEDTTPAEITGVSITVDDVPYTSGNVTITPETQSIIFTVTGTNFANLSDDNYLHMSLWVGDYLNNGNWTIDAEANTVTLDLSDYISWFEDCNDYEVKYSNDGQQTWTGTGIYLTYDAGISEEDKAVITGVSIKVGETVYTSGSTVTLTPESGDVTFIVTGTNLQNATSDNMVLFKSGYSQSMGSSYAWNVNETGTEASYTFSIVEFASQTTAYEIEYSNDNGQSLKNTGVYVIYNDGTGGEEDTTSAKITGVTITVDGETYSSGNVTITHTSTVVYTVTGTNFANLTSDHYLMIAPDRYTSQISAYWAVDAVANTVTVDLSEWVHLLEACDNFEVKYSNDGQRTWIGTGIYLTYHDDTKQLLLKTVDTDGNVIDGTLDAMLYTGEAMVGWIANTSEGYNKWYVSVGENTITDWDLCPAGYVKPTEAITFTADADGNITITSNNATLEVTDTVVYIVVTLIAEGGEEDTTAKITGVTVTGGYSNEDGEVYVIEGGEGITVTVTGERFAALTEAHMICVNDEESLTAANGWTIDPETNTAVKYFASSEVSNTSITYRNPGDASDTDAGIIIYTLKPGTTLETIYFNTGGDSDWATIRVIFYHSRTATIGADMMTLVDGNIYATQSEIPGAAYFVCFMNTASGNTDLIQIPADGSNMYNLADGTWSHYDPSQTPEDTTPAEITGVSITVDNVPYTSGNVTIYSDSEVTITMTGTNFANATADNFVFYAWGTTTSIDDSRVTVNSTATPNTASFNLDGTVFSSLTDAFEIQYSNDGGQSWTGTGIYLTYEEGTGGGESELISVNISWGEMSFTYTDGEWQPESHTYADGEWTPDVDGGNVITVTNNGNVAVNVTFAYNKTVTEVEGSFTENSPFVLATNDSKEIKLILNGKPSSTLEDTQLGTVTVKITLPEQQAP